MTATITGISSMATRLILGELAQRYEAARGVKVQVASVGGVDAAKRVREGEAIDIVILASGPMAKLEAEGHLVAGSVKGFTRSGMAIAARSDNPALAAAFDYALQEISMKGTFAEFYLRYFPVSFF